MQIDMHYYGTFALAYAAGLEASDAQVVAMSAQLVDDNNFTRLHELDSGHGVVGVATAHHPIEAGIRVAQGGSKDDSRLIWVPFHFLPAGKGDTFEEKVVCQEKSELARSMVDYYTSPAVIEAHRGHALQLIGIAAHVYADTFSHHGFSGISSDLNEVEADTIEFDQSHSEEIVAYVRNKASAFMDRFVAHLGGTSRLGHGAVATLPDRPYLKWSYRTSASKVERDNPEVFLDACKSLHEMFCRFREAFYAGKGATRMGFDRIEPLVREILAHEAEADERLQNWLKAARAGAFGAAIEIPEYSPTAWEDELQARQSLTYDAVADRVIPEGYNFFTAADYHRNYVLKRLLPSVGLFVA